MSALGRYWKLALGTFWQISSELRHLKAKRARLRARFVCVHLRLSAAEFKRLSQRYAQAFHQLLTRSFLAIDARNLLDPAEPPLAGFLNYSGVRAFHILAPHEHWVSKRLSK